MTRLTLEPSSAFHPIYILLIAIVTAFSSLFLHFLVYTLGIRPGQLKSDTFQSKLESSRLKLSDLRNAARKAKSTTDDIHVTVMKCEREIIVLEKDLETLNVSLTKASESLKKWIRYGRFTVYLSVIAFLASRGPPVCFGSLFPPSNANVVSGENVGKDYISSILFPLPYMVYVWPSTILLGEGCGGKIGPLLIVWSIETMIGKVFACIASIFENMT